MAKATSSLVVALIFLVMFSLVEENMGCRVDYGSCKDMPNCQVFCQVKFGSAASGSCEGGYETGRCFCDFPGPCIGR
ncbi:unnamed protein product [Eruca vesicaria subsp. sativa]|uniref:Defensin-like protein n=1 Tax=Eruca vesicaria subsp. sativa TaxID=29727 RepID=A0ABC8K1E9_ERUVS|nr:unnamed protein product [Eruca vesicaria subsp. sativa]